MKLEPAPESMIMTSVKILDNMDNKVKERIPNYKDDSKKLYY